MKRCGAWPHCGVVLDDDQDDRFCPECRQRLEIAKQKAFAKEFKYGIDELPITLE